MGLKFVAQQLTKRSQYVNQENNQLALENYAYLIVCELKRIDPANGYYSISHRQIYGVGDIISFKDVEVLRKKTFLGIPLSSERLQIFLLG